MKSRQARVLYFTKRPKPTDKEVAHAQSLSANVGYRFAALDKNVAMEACDAVAGTKVPMMYREAGIPYVKTTADLRKVTAKGEPVDEFDADASAEEAAALAETDPAANQGGDQNNGQQNNQNGQNGGSGADWGKSTS